jgi:hypothetical protein
MTTTLELLKQGKKDELWTKHCGYLDLSVDEFMEIQERLLFEQIEFLKTSEIGKKLFGDKVPTTIEEFCNSVNLTTYKDYHPYLKDRSAASLPFEPFVWTHTTGSSGEYQWKWAPYTKRMYDHLGEGSLSAIIMSSCTKKGEVHIEPDDVLLLGTAPRPYMSGELTASVEEQFGATFVPSLKQGENMEFGERINLGFSMAMLTGLDYFYGLASILVRIGERFESGAGSVKFSPAMLRPNVLFRLLKGVLGAKFAKRKMLPKDIWKCKGILCGGTDTSIYRDKIKYYWGKEPLEGYASTEAGIIALQTYSFKAMTMLPHSNFFEFIPYDEHIKGKQNPEYTPKTVLFKDLKIGIYELVFTNLLGGVFTRYRVGDLIEVVSMRDEEIGIELPQIQFFTRADNLLDLGNIARFTEKSIWHAMEVSGIKYVDWIARKEEFNGEPDLHFYIELASDVENTEEELVKMVRDGLINTSSEFVDLENISGKKYIKVTKLPKGAFARYIEEQRLAGADLAQMKPSHIQAPEKVISRLLQKG